MSYDLTIRNRDGKGTIKRVRAEEVIRALPGVGPASEGVFQYKARNPNIGFQIFLPNGDEATAMEISVPAGFTSSSMDLGVICGFELADKLGWGVYDEQIGRFLDEETRRELLTHRKRFGKSPRTILARVAQFDEGFAEAFVRHFAVFQGTAFCLLLILSAVVAGTVVVWWKLPIDTPLYFVVIWVACWIMATAMRAAFLGALRK